MILCRFSVSTGKYLAIKCPKFLRDDESWLLKASSLLRKSGKGVYYTTTDKESWLQVWTLNEESEASHGTQPVWEMVHYVNIEPPMRQLLQKKKKKKKKNGKKKKNIGI